MATKEKVIGILGGMGPYATIDFYKKIVDNTPAEKDCNHFRIIIDNNPKIPSRTRAVILGDKSPLPDLISSAQNLEEAGASFIVITCNSAHFYIEEVQKKINIPILDMIKITSQYIIQNNPNIKKVGLLGGLVTYKAKLYEKGFQGKIKIINPSENEKNELMSEIHKIKNNNSANSSKIVLKLIKSLIHNGAQGIILGCTELPLIMRKNNYKNVKFFDPAEIVAKYIINKYHKNENLY